MIFEDDTPGILSCSRPQNLWITWSNRYLKFGKGALGEDVILEWTNTTGGGEDDSLDQIRKIAVGTSLEDVGEWIIPKHAGTGAMTTGPISACLTDIHFP